MHDVHGLVIKYCPLKVYLMEWEGGEGGWEGRERERGREGEREGGSKLSHDILHAITPFLFTVNK